MSTPSTPSRATELMAASSWSLRRTGNGRTTRPSRLADFLCVGKASNLGWGVGVEHQPYSRRPWRSILEKLDALAGQPLETLHHRHAGDVAARPRQAGDEARTHRITGHQDDRNGRGDSLEGADRKVAECDQDIRPELHQLGGEIGHAIVAALAEAVLDDDVLPFDIANSFRPWRNPATSVGFPA